MLKSIIQKKKKTSFSRRILPQVITKRPRSSPPSQLKPQLKLLGFDELSYFLGRCHIFFVESRTSSLSSSTEPSRLSYGIRIQAIEPKLKLRSNFRYLIMVDGSLEQNGEPCQEVFDGSGSRMPLYNRTRKLRISIEGGDGVITRDQFKNGGILISFQLTLKEEEDDELLVYRTMSTEEDSSSGGSGGSGGSFIKELISLNQFVQIAGTIRILFFGQQNSFVIEKSHGFVSTVNVPIHHKQKMGRSDFELDQLEPCPSQVGDETNQLNAQKLSQKSEFPDDLVSSLEAAFAKI